MPREVFAVADPQPGPRDALAHVPARDVPGLLDRLLDRPWSWHREDLDAHLAAFGARRRDDAHAAYILFVSDVLPKQAAYGRTDATGERVCELLVWLTNIGTAHDAAHTDVVRRLYDVARAHLEARCGPPPPQYPRGESRGGIYGEEHRYVHHRLPNGKDIVLPHGVDPYTPLVLDPATHRLKWPLDDDRELALSVAPSVVAVVLHHPAPPLEVDGLAVTWDGRR